MCCACSPATRSSNAVIAMWAGNGYTYANMLASCAFNVLTGEHGMKPGTVNPDIISQYLPNATMKPHVLRAGVFL